MNELRKLTPKEIETLETHHCSHPDWSLVKVKDGFKPDYIFDTQFSGQITLRRWLEEYRIDARFKKTRLYSIAP
jgi:hypothetical protein